MESKRLLNAVEQNVVEKNAVLGHPQGCVFYLIQ
jgi:hypothetical protein